MVGRRLRIGIQLHSFPPSIAVSLLKSLCLGLKRQSSSPDLSANWPGNLDRASGSQSLSLLNSWKELSSVLTVVRVGSRGCVDRIKEGVPSPLRSPQQAQAVCSPASSGICWNGEENGQRWTQQDPQTAAVLVSLEHVPELQAGRCFFKERGGGAVWTAASERDFSPHDCLLEELF